MRRFGRLIAYGAAAVIAGLLLLALTTARARDPSLWPPAPGAPTVEVFVVSHGYHAGLALPTASLAGFTRADGKRALPQIAQRFADYPFVEVGWGDQGFYSSVPDVSSLTIGMAVRALFRPGNPSVLHVVGLPDRPQRVFPSAEIVRIDVSEHGFARMLETLDASFARDENDAVQGLGGGLYGHSLFYRANGHFHLFNVCNHWVANMLSAAGLPVTPVLATLPVGLLRDLRWRAGLSPLGAAS